MQTNLVHWFEIPVSKLKRAQKFYEAVFDCKLEVIQVEESQMQMLQFPMNNDCYGIGGALVQAEDYYPSHNGSLVYFNVEDIDATLKKVVNNKGKTLLPKTAIGEYGFIAHFEDSEGNRVALHSMKK